MKVLSINAIEYSPSFGEVDEIPKRYYKANPKEKSHAMDSNTEILKSKQFSYVERMRFARKLALDTLDISVEGKELGLFEKMSYLIKRKRIAKIGL